ncbi:MAG: ribose 5-phosphate isomerase B [Planctomycetota bacterium]
MDRQRLYRIVRKALEEVAGKTPAARAPAACVPPVIMPAKKSAEGPVSSGLVTEADVRAARPQAWLALAKGTIVTPAAREAAERYGVELRRGAPAGGWSTSSVALALGSDHAGFAVKQRIKALLERNGVAVHDVGAHNTDPVDYPDIAHDVARAVASGACRAGILIDGAGIGSCMAANKVAGVRAANPMSVEAAINSRRHNDANVLCLGSRLLPFEALRAILQTWLEEPFEGGRHAARVDKIEAGS